MSKNKTDSGQLLNWLATSSIAILGSCWLGLPLGSVAQAEAPGEQTHFSSTEIEFFEAKVRPLLIEHCYACHSGQTDKLQAGLRLDSRSAALRGGDSGPAVVPGDPTTSLLIESIHYESYEMPPKGKLSDEDIATLERWIALGAPWPNETLPSDAAASDVVGPAAFDLQQRAQQHWAWQPLTHPTPPAVHDAHWPLDELDHFILARLEKAELSPAADVDRLTLLRRLCFDLIGLPPTIEQIVAMEADDDPASIQCVVDDLLQSPHFGERWGRHWLDLVRYAESRGHEFDDEAENAYQYRDYVIRALNADVPYDQFVCEHIAGDLLASPRLHPSEGFNESILGTGFWFLGEWVHSPVDIRKDETDRFDNMIDVMSKTFLSVTVACARCHDHKFDAISSADYYALSGFLQSSDYRQVRFDSIEHNRQIASQLAVLDQEMRNRINELLAVNSLAEDSFADRLTGATLVKDDMPLASRALASDQDTALPAELPADLPDCQLTIDYSKLPADDFFQDGFIFGQQPVRCGDFFLGHAANGKPELQCIARSAAVSDPLWRGLQSSGQVILSRSALSGQPRSGRTLRTATFELSAEHLFVRVRGAGHVFACVDSHQLVAGPLHGQTVQSFGPEPRWVELDLSRYVGHHLHLEFTPDEATQLEIGAVLQAASRAAVADMITAIEQREREQELLAAQRMQRIAELQSQQPQFVEQLATLASQWHSRRTELQADIQQSSRLAMAMIDGSGEDDRVLIRGSSSNPGKIEPRHFLSAIVGQSPQLIPHGSGRLELAAQINDPSNPLPARVIVNRVWHHLLGRGIVPTTDDFGMLGQPPTDPELLDHLASEFLADGQSIKRLIRRIVLSRTYRMSGELDPRAQELDPLNNFWHHRPPLRLQGEVIRDALLAISGQLDPTQFGEPIPVHLTTFMDGRGRPATSGPLAGNGRRSIYIAVRRNFLSPFMLAFDTPSPFSTMGRRNSSNVPAQALIMMNDPLVVELVGHWAQRGLQAVPSRAGPQVGLDSESRATISSDIARIEWFYRSGLGRPPTTRETGTTRQFVLEQATERKTSTDAPEIWSDLAHALVNTKEFIFLR